MASYLQTSGIPMGENLLGGGVGNERGHYEDKDFLEFHKLLLKKNRSFTYIPKQSINVDEKDKSIAKTLIKKHCQNNPVWGWKDPRSTLFLDFWAECDPNIRFILLYREPQEVVSSLCRRLKKFKSPILFLMPWLGCIAWLRYNSKLLYFHEKYPSRSILVSINGFIKSPRDASDLVWDWLSIDSENRFSDVYHPEDIQIGNKTKHISVFERYEKLVSLLYKKKMTELHDRLNSSASIPFSGC